MTQYYIIEIKMTAAGDYEHNVYYAYDEDPDQARLKGESKWHELLSAAAVSTMASHAVTLIASNGRAVKSECYEHPQANQARQTVPE